MHDFARGARKWTRGQWAWAQHTTEPVCIASVRGISTTCLQPTPCVAHGYSKMRLGAPCILAKQKNPLLPRASERRITTEHITRLISWEVLGAPKSYWEQHSAHDWRSVGVCETEKKIVRNQQNKIPLSFKLLLFLIHLMFKATLPNR